MLCVGLFGATELPQGHDDKVEDADADGQENGEEVGGVVVVISGFALKVDAPENIEVNHRNGGHEVNKSLGPFDLQAYVKA